MQKIFLTGNLGADPIVKTFDNGGKVANFSVGVTERGFKTKEGKEIPDHTEWFRCVCGKTGTCNLLEQYIKKGHKVAIVGKFKTRKYDKDGQELSITELIVEELEPLTAKSQLDNSSQTQEAQVQQESKDDGLPF